MTQMSSLMCDEVLDTSSFLNQTPEHKPEIQDQFWMDSWESPVTVKAIQDTTQIKDVRILQNLLRNEERFVPEVPDYMTNVQTHINAEMRRRVATWLLEIVQEQNSQPDILCVAVNIMDRFLCHHRIPKESFQLLGAVSLLIASKIREPCPIPGKNLIIYSDNSITAQELKVS